MESKDGELIFSQAEATHIICSHHEISSAHNDTDVAVFIRAVASKYREVKRSDNSKSDIVVENNPISREFLAKRILRQEVNLTFTKPAVKPDNQANEANDTPSSTNKTTEGFMSRLIKRSNKDNH